MEQLVIEVAVEAGLHSHQAVLHGVGSPGIDTIFTARRKELALLDLIRPNALGNTNHPEELVDIVAGISQKATENNQDIIHLVLAHDGIADFLAGGHSLADSRDVCVVPGVVVDKRGTVGHATNLVAIIPPRHDLGIILGVLAQPLIRLTIIVNDVLATIGHPTGQDD